MSRVAAGARGPGKQPAALRGPLPWLVAGVIGWAGVAWIGWMLWQSSPPRAGFDLSLLLGGARAILAGRTPYDAAMLAGIAPGAADLFYSYPPPVAQAMTLLAWLPDGVVLVLWGVGATAGLAGIAGGLARTGTADASSRGSSPTTSHRGSDARSTALRTIAIAPFVLPFAIALLFGNLDAWFPLLYGALVLSALPGATPRVRLLAGVAVAVATIAKLHPAPLVAWIVARALAERGGPQARVLACGAIAGVAVIGVSLLVGGIGPWQDYVTVVRAGADAGLVDPRNIGPVSLLGQATGLGSATLRLVAAVVGAGALGIALLAGLRVRDPLAGLSLAVAASLVTLPVTWYHYPVALVPVALALAIRRPSTRPWLVAAVVVADVAIAVPPLLWVSVAIVAWAAIDTGRAERPGVAATRGTADAAPH